MLNGLEQSRIECVPGTSSVFLSFKIPRLHFTGGGFPASSSSELLELSIGGSADLNILFHPRDFEGVISSLFLTSEDAVLLLGSSVVDISTEWDGNGVGRRGFPRRMPTSPSTMKVEEALGQPMNGS